MRVMLSHDSRKSKLLCYCQVTVDWAETEKNKKQIWPAKSAQLVQTLMYECARKTNALLHTSTITHNFLSDARAVPSKLLKQAVKLVFLSFNHDAHPSICSGHTTQISSVPSRAPLTSSAVQQSSPAVASKPQDTNSASQGPTAPATSQTPQKLDQTDFLNYGFLAMDPAPRGSLDSLGDSLDSFDGIGPDGDLSSRRLPLPPKPIFIISDCTGVVHQINNKTI